MSAIERIEKKIDRLKMEVVIFETKCSGDRQDRNLEFEKCLSQIEALEFALAIIGEEAEMKKVASLSDRKKYRCEQY